MDDEAVMPNVQWEKKLNSDFVSFGFHTSSSFGMIFQWKSMVFQYNYGVPLELCELGICDPVLEEPAHSEPGEC